VHSKVRNNETRAVMPLTGSEKQWQPFAPMFHSNAPLRPYGDDATIESAVHKDVLT
jgi:hypothetical protein